MSGISSLPLLQASSVTGGDDLSVLALIGLALMSLVVGLIGGLVGIALGVIRLPSMTFFGVDPFLAAGTNLFVSMVGALAASWPAFVQQRVAVRVAILLGVPAVVGSLIGGIYADIVPAGALLGLVGMFLLWSAISMFVRSMSDLRGSSRSLSRRNYTDRVELTRRTMVREGVVGMIIGLVGGAAGLALGFLRLPAMVQVLKMHPGVAAGTNLLITILIGLAGFFGHLIAGRVDWTLVAVLGSTGTLGMYVGSRFTDKVDPVKLRLALSLVLFVIAPFVFYGAVTR